MLVKKASKSIQSKHAEYGSNTSIGSASSEVILSFPHKQGKNFLFLFLSI